MASAATMSEDEYRGLVKTGSISNFGFNVVINGGIAWWLLSGSEVLTPFGDASYGPDLLITGLLLSAIVSAIGIATHKGKVVKGTLGVPDVAGPGWLDSAITWSRFKTCAVIGLAGTAASGLVIAVMAVSIGSISVPAYVIGKALYTGVLAVALTGPTTLLGLRLGGVSAEAAAA